MNGAIPYYKIQARNAHGGIKTTAANHPWHPEKLQLMLCSMAHQINNLLMRIQGYASLMLMDVKQGQVGYERLMHIENHIGYGAVLTSQLLACAGRGVYADPVNIPPLLLQAQDPGGAAPGEYDVRSRLFIVGNANPKIRPGFMDTLREINLKIAGLFGGIENVIMSGRRNQIEKQYVGKIRRATGEGARIARDAAAVLKPTRSRPVFRHPGTFPRRAVISPANSASR